LLHDREDGSIGMELRACTENTAFTAECAERSERLAEGFDESPSAHVFVSAAAVVKGFPRMLLAKESFFDFARARGM